MSHTYSCYRAKVGAYLSSAVMSMLVRSRLAWKGDDQGLLSGQVSSHHLELLRRFSTPGVREKAAWVRIGAGKLDLPGVSLG